MGSILHGRVSSAAVITLLIVGFVSGEDGRCLWESFCMKQYIVLQL